MFRADDAILDMRQNPGVDLGVRVPAEKSQ
jgi:hypothetical protein